MCRSRLTPRREAEGVSEAGGEMGKGEGLGRGWDREGTAGGGGGAAWGEGGGGRRTERGGRWGGGGG